MDSETHAMPEGGWPIPTEEEDRAVVSSMFHRYVHPGSPDSTYVVSHTGLIVEVITQNGPSKKRDDSEVTKWVVSMVNGSMAHNPLGQVVDCINFDEYIMDWFMLPYQQHRVIGIAYFNPATCSYEEVAGPDAPPYPHRTAPAAV